MNDCCTLLCRQIDTVEGSCFECAHLMGEFKPGSLTQQCGLMDLVERYEAHPQELMRITCDSWADKKWPEVPK